MGSFQAIYLDADGSIIALKKASAIPATWLKKTRFAVHKFLARFDDSCLYNMRFVLFYLIYLLFIVLFVC
jgi:hypothetical protein